MYKKEMFGIKRQINVVVINRLSGVAVLYALALLCSCQNTDKSPKDGHVTHHDSLLHSVTEAVAIGKVIPEKGWISISSAVPGKVLHLAVSEGDRVHKDQLLMRFSSDQASLDITKSSALLENLQQQYAADLQDYQREQNILSERKKIYETSLELFKKDAETRERVNEDRSSVEQQEIRLRVLNQKLKASQSTITEQKIAVQQMNLAYRDFQLTAADSGTVCELNVRLGQSINGNDELGRIADLNHLVIEAEIDELLADKIAVGQISNIQKTSDQQFIGSGKVIYVSPALSNKSILYETGGELVDRRVRRIKIRPEQGTKLLVNTKVTCKIQFH